MIVNCYRKILELLSLGRNLGLEFNIDKCYTTSFRKTSNSLDYVYVIYNTPLSYVDNKVVYLRVIFYRKLSFHAHIETIYYRPLKMLGFVKEICNEFKLVNSLKILYCAFIRSMLEYCTAVWDPHIVYGKNYVAKMFLTTITLY